MGANRATLDAIEAVYRGRGLDFFRLAVAMTADADLAQDAVQEGFARAIRARGSFRASGSLDAWIGRCVMNAARDAVSRTNSPPSVPEAVGEPWTPERDVGAVRDAVRRLPQRQRDALFLRFYLDFDYAAIADVLGIEVGTVSATLHAARAKLAQNLQEVTR
jgi:RNA polymerase sigma factor (sigma-70 family)